MGPTVSYLSLIIWRRAEWLQLFGVENLSQQCELPDHEGAWHSTSHVYSLFLALYVGVLVGRTSGKCVYNCA